MTDKEAQEAAFEKYSADFNGTLGAENFEDHKRGWDDALEWVKKGQEPVGWIWPKEKNGYLCVTKMKTAPDFSFWDKKARPLYTHPAPHPDVSELVEVLKGFASIISESKGVAGYHLNGATAEWDEFEEVYQLFSTLEKLMEGVENE